MLETLHLTKRYASLPAVQDVSFSLRPGHAGIRIVGTIRSETNDQRPTRRRGGVVHPTSSWQDYDEYRARDDLRGRSNQDDRGVATRGLIRETRSASI